MVLPSIVLRFTHDARNRFQVKRGQ